MTQTPLTYALTTKDRVKARLSQTGTAFDTVIDAMIGAVTDRVEGECGGRRFLRTTYTNELITIFNTNQEILSVRNIPLISVSSLQYRTGLKSNPNYTSFNTDDWEIINDGAAGLIRVWGMSAAVNLIRISYIGGYLIDFSNAGSPTAHTLPLDLSDLAERLTVKVFKKREHEGKASEAFEGATVTWEKFITDDDRAVISRYTRLPTFV